MMQIMNFVEPSALGAMDVYVWMCLCHQVHFLKVFAFESGFVSLSDRFMCDKLFEYHSNIIKLRNIKNE